MIFCYLKQYLPTDLAENLLSTKKMQMKAWYMILDTEMSWRVTKSSTVKLLKSQRKMNYTGKNEHSLENIASNLSCN